MKEQELTELDCLNEYFKQRTEDNVLFKHWFNLGKQSAFSGQCIQIQKFDSVCNTNEFLKNIPKENIIKVEQLENNTYLVTQSEEMK